jgi:hypothetical protein
MSEGWFALLGAAVGGVLGVFGTRLQSNADLRKALTLNQLERRQQTYLVVVHHLVSISAWLSWVKAVVHGESQGIESPPVPDQGSFDSMLAQTATFGSEAVRDSLRDIWASWRNAFSLVRGPGPASRATFPPLNGVALATAEAAIEDVEQRSDALVHLINRELQPPQPTSWLDRWRRRKRGMTEGGAP